MLRQGQGTGGGGCNPPPHSSLRGYRNGPQRRGVFIPEGVPEPISRPRRRGFVVDQAPPPDRARCCPRIGSRTPATSPAGAPAPPRPLLARVVLRPERAPPPPPPAGPPLPRPFAGGGGRETPPPPGGKGPSRRPPGLV